MSGTAKWSLALAALLVVAPQVVAQTSAVLDPIGDGEGFKVPLFQDIVRAEVSKKGNAFRFVMEVANRIPASPPLDPPGVKLQEWSFRLDTDPTTCPAGFPFSSAPLTAAADIMVFVLWDGVSFTAFVIDRTPSLTGGEAVITPVPFDIKRREITVSVDAAIIGDPGSFGFRGFTEVWNDGLGTDSWQVLDIAPNGVHVFANWPPPGSYTSSCPLVAP